MWFMGGRVATHFAMELISKYSSPIRLWVAEGECGVCVCVCVRVCVLCDEWVCVVWWVCVSVCLFILLETCITYVQQLEWAGILHTYIYSKELKSLQRALQWQILSHMRTTYIHFTDQTFACMYVCTCMYVSTRNHAKSCCSWLNWDWGNCLSSWKSIPTPHRMRGLPGRSAKGREKCCLRKFGRKQSTPFPLNVCTHAFRVDARLRVTPSNEWKTSTSLEMCVVWLRPQYNDPPVITDFQLGEHECHYM